MVTEFLPNLPCPGKDNTISCTAAFYFYEGRWSHDQQYLGNYSRFWFQGGGNPHLYSFWLKDALYIRFIVTNDTTFILDLLPDLISNYEIWGKTKLDSIGLFWQIDGRDGMGLSICGSGYRATINSYIYRGAIAHPDSS